MTSRLWKKLVCRWPVTVSSLLGALTVLLVTGVAHAAAADQTADDSVIEPRYEGSRVETRIESIKITQLDFTYRETPHCLEFEWIYKESRRPKIIDHQTYTYCPNKGMVKQVKH